MVRKRRRAGRKNTTKNLGVSEYQRCYMTTEYNACEHFGIEKYEIFMHEYVATFTCETKWS
jgi:hypothetical protein